MSTNFSPLFPETGNVPASYADWLAQVQRDLKDPNAHEELRWHSPEGFTVDPYYTAEHLDKQTVVGAAIPGVQAAQKARPGWLNTPAYTVKTGGEKELNTRLRDALTNGADALLLNVPDGASLTRLLDGIKLSDTPVFFRLETGVDTANFLQTLRQIAPYQLRGGILAESGTLPAHTLANLLEQTSESPSFRPVGINSHDFHTAGATATQELAFTVARLAELIEQLQETGLPLTQLLPKMMLSVSVGTSYFMEMAKLRALRVLVARLFPVVASDPVLVHCQTSTFFEASATPYTNLLRATTEAMAAVIGGADALTVRPYNAVLSSPENQPGEFSERIARNVSTLMKAESYLDKVADPAAGSYYIETLTYQLIEAAWALFQHVTELGGLAKATESGYVQQEIDRAYNAKIDAIKNGRVLVGVTKFRHDEAGGEVNKATQSNSGLNQVARRLSSEFE